jgi:hypothetical protein
MAQCESKFQTLYFLLDEELCVDKILSLDIWGQDQMTEENSFRLNFFFCMKSCAAVKIEI